MLLNGSNRHLPNDINSLADLRLLQETLILEVIGAGYHPDTAAENYETPQGEPLFGDRECRRLNRLHREAIERFPNETYTIGLEILNSMPV